MRRTSVAPFRLHLCWCSLHTVSCDPSHGGGAAIADKHGVLAAAEGEGCFEGSSAKGSRGGRRRRTCKGDADLLPALSTISYISLGNKNTACFYYVGYTSWCLAGVCKKVFGTKRLQQRHPEAGAAVHGQWPLENLIAFCLLCTSTRANINVPLAADRCK